MGTRQLLYLTAIVATLSVSLRLAIAAVALGEEHRPLAPDSLEYLALADSLVAGRGFTVESTPVYDRVPGYPVFLAAARLALGESAIVGVLTCQAATIVIPLAAFYWLMRCVLLAQPDSCFATTLILSFDPALVAYSAMVLSEAWAFVLSSLFLTLGMVSIRRGGYLCTALAGACSGVTALVHPSATYVWVVGALVHLTIGERPFARRVALATCLVVSHVLILSPWLLRNYASFGDPSLARIRDRSLILKAAIIEAYALDEPPHGVRGFVSAAGADGIVMRSFEERHHGRTSPVGRDLVVATVLRYPRAAVITGIAGVAVLFFDPCHAVVLKTLGQPAGTGLISGATHGLWEALRTRPIPAVVAAWSGLWIIAFMACTAVGAVRGARHARPIFVFCFAYCCYYTAVFSYGALTAGGRYRLLMVPALALLAGLAIPRPGEPHSFS